MCGWKMERKSVFACLPDEAGDRQVRDNVERKLDFPREQQDENANVI